MSDVLLRHRSRRRLRHSSKGRTHREDSEFFGGSRLPRLIVRFFRVKRRSTGSFQRRYATINEDRCPKSGIQTFDFPHTTGAPGITTEPANPEVGAASAAGELPSNGVVSPPQQVLFWL